jgi:hypothetical protein
MNRDVLTLLGCSGSLVMVLAGSPAKAILPPGTMENSTKIDLSTASQLIATEQAPQAAPQATSDRLKQLASSIFGCTCANCVNAVQQMIQQGTLSL